MGSPPVKKNKVSLSVAFVVALVFYSIINASASFFPRDLLLSDPDTFWHIQTGQWILDHWQVPTVDFFSYTAAGRPWISTEWLSEIVFAIAFNIGGWHVVSNLAAIFCAVSIGILCFYLLRHLRFSVAIGWTAVTAMAIMPHALARPHIFSYVVLIIWMTNLIEAYESDNFTRRLFVLAPLMVLWANIHGSFTFGLGLLYLFIGFSLYKKFVQRIYVKCWPLLVVLLIITFCAVLTPYGISSALMTKGLLDLKYTIPQIVELQSPNFQNDYIHSFLLVVLLSAMAGLGVRLRGPTLVAFGIIVFVGLSYNRGLVMFFLLSPIILARPFATSACFLAPQFSGEELPNADIDPMLQYLQKRLFAVLATSVTVAALATVLPWWLRDVAPPKSIAPAAAIDFVRRSNIKGNVFNDYNFGGFLIWSHIPTFVDGRALPFGDDFLHKYFDALVDFDSAFQILNEYNIGWVILMPRLPLAKAIARYPSWVTVYSDEYSVIFERRPK